MQELLATSWKVLVLRGLLGIVFGFFAIFWPIETAVALAVLWGIWAIVDGIGSLAAVFSTGTPVGLKVLAVLMGLVALVAGIFAVTSPGLTAVALTWILGIWLVVRGALTVVLSFTSQMVAPKALAIATGVLDVVIGILFASHPGKSAVGIAVLLGILALAWGLAFVVLGFSVRQSAKDLAAAE